MYTVYVLQSQRDNRTYTGFTEDFENRRNLHNSGQVNSTRHRTPFKVLFTENVQTEKEAKSRELYWKSGAGRRKLKKYFLGNGQEKASSNGK